MTPLSSWPHARRPTLTVASGDGGADNGAAGAFGFLREPRNRTGAQPSPLPLPRRRGQTLAPFLDYLADCRRPVRARARDRVHLARGVRRHLVAVVQPCPAVARERGDPRL